MCSSWSLVLESGCLETTHSRMGISSYGMEWKRTQTVLQNEKKMKKVN